MRPELSDPVTPLRAVESEDRAARLRVACVDCQRSHTGRCRQHRNRPGSVQAVGEPLASPRAA